MIKARFKYILLSLCLLIFCAAIIILPDRYVNCCFAGFAMWAECVLPSLFPFMVITLIFVKSGIAERASLPLTKLAGKFKLPPAAGACFLLGICSGYPAGSRVLYEYYENGSLTRGDVKKLAYLCSTSGPLFIIGSVGFKMFGDKTAGAKILIAHVLSVTAVSLIICLFSKKSAAASYKRAPADRDFLYNSFYGAVVAVTVAGAFIAFFYVVATFVSDFSLLAPVEMLLQPLIGDCSKAANLGLIEATTGCKALAGLGASKLNIALAGFMITFGGASIIMQQLCYLLKAGVSAAKFIGVKFLQALLCFALLLIIA